MVLGEAFGHLSRKRCVVQVQRALERSDMDKAVDRLGSAFVWIEVDVSTDLGKQFNLPF